jgi:arylsulfatase A-like enzyme
MRLALIAAVSAVTVIQAAYSAAADTARSPNVVVVFCDDLGYGDLGCFGARGWATPNLDRLAADGVKFTSFYTAQPVCSASRAALLTGCYANRIGIHGALGPNARHGIHSDETTLAELLKSRGYATACIGKWHLGHHPMFLPTRHGFDEYFGLPYSNDMWPNHPEAKRGTYPPLPLLDGEKVVNADVSAEDQTKLTASYTERAVRFIEKNATRPFFLYLAHSMPHVPLFAGEKFRGKSKQGLYGDVLQEIDASVGEILSALKKHDLERDTLVIFTSDNGPWLSYGNHAGSAGPLREGKGTVWEGGVRVPFVARWPGQISAGATCSEPAMTIDILPTLARLVRAELPKHPIDGRDIWPLLTNPRGARSPHEAYFFYYHTGELHAVRSGRWKLMLPHTSRSMQGQKPGKDGTPGKYRQEKIALSLFDLEADIGETKNLAEQHPAVVKELLAHVEKARGDLGDSLTKRKGTGVREPGRLTVSK